MHRLELASVKAGQQHSC